jgi:thymidylate synthase (FAD)
MPLENDSTSIGGCESPASRNFVTHYGTHEPIKVPGDAKLLEYLYSNGHTTPFEMCELHLEVLAPILVWRQWHRHRTQSYNEQSARYGPLPDLFYTPTEERLRESFKASANKQASGKMVKGDDLPSPRVYAASIEVEQRNDRLAYEARLDDGMAPELARINVPVSQYSKCRVKTDLHNWLGFLRLRMDEHAQWEIRQYALAVGQIVKQLWPRTWALFEEHTLGAVRLSRGEVSLLRTVMEGGATPPITDAGRKLLAKLGIAGAIHAVGRWYP